MNLEIINQSSQRIPKKWMQSWISVFERKLSSKTEIDLKNWDLVCVFLPINEARKMNLQFRGKDYATDVLSFSSDLQNNHLQKRKKHFINKQVKSPEPLVLGELVLCPEVLKRQAKENGHSFRAELGYMLIHGVLHLLGYDHEKSKKQAKEMFDLQDQLFDSLRDKFQI